MYICKKVHFTVPSTTFKSYIINTPSVVNAHVFQSTIFKYLGFLKKDLSGRDIQGK